MEVYREEEYIVEEILNSHIRWKMLEYLAKWRGYTKPVGISTRDINGLAAIIKFNALYPKRPGALLEDRQ